MSLAPGDPPGREESPRVGHTLETVEGRLLLRLARPERRNALDESFADSLTQTFAELGQSWPGRPLVLCAEGPAFCAGADISFMKSLPPEAREAAFADRARTLTPALVRLIEAVEMTPLVTIAAVNGAASGGGWGLALACDFRIASTQASFWFPEAEYGRPLSERSIALLLAHTGRARTAEIVLAAKRFTAAELLPMGLVNEVVEPGALMERTQALATRLSKLTADGLAVSKERIVRLSRARAS